MAADLWQDAVLHTVQAKSAMPFAQSLEKCGIARAKIFLLPSLPLKYFEFLIDKASGKDHVSLERSCISDETIFCFILSWAELPAKFIPFAFNLKPIRNCIAEH